MSLHDKEKRKSRRIPMECKVKVKILETREVYYGVSRDLSVDGISFEAEYVPRYGEVLEVLVAPPPGSTIQPLRALMLVKRCNEIRSGQYEIAGPIRVLKDDEHAAAVNRRPSYLNAAA